MGLHLKISGDDRGAWSVHGLRPRPVCGLPSLSASIDYARQESAAAPATIELLIDGVYLVVYQERGWPRPLLVPEPDPPYPATAEAEANPDGMPMARRLLAWLRGEDSRDIDSRDIDSRDID